MKMKGMFGRIDEKTKFILLVLAYITFFFMPSFVPSASNESTNPLMNGLFLLHDYAQKHILTCLVPAMFIAGAISIFVRKNSILKYLGSDAKKHLSYGIASVSGAILAVCSCTILPLFAGIRKRGAGLGPATTFLFSGPAINIAAVFLTISVLGPEIGIARISFAVILSILVGLSMHLIFREKSEKNKLFIEESKEINTSERVLLLFLLSMVGVLIANGLQIDWVVKYSLMLLLTIITGLIAIYKLPRENVKEWLTETWRFTKLLLPILFVGVFIAGIIMPLVPREVIEDSVGSNSIQGNLIAAIFGAFMYFSTLTEIPILQALIAKGMAKGPALSLLLAGPSLSLPNMLVIRGVLGNKMTLVYITLVIVYSTMAGLIFGLL